LPFYYSIASTHTTSATAATELDALRLLTVATRQCICTRLIVGAAGAAQDNQVMAKLWRMSTASTVGSAFVPQSHDQGSPAAVTTPFTGPTIGTKNTNATLILPFNSRAMVQWVALNPDEAITLHSNGGANGNIDLLDEEAAAVAVVMRYQLTFSE
jgi:hypothetical protein